MCFSFDLFQKKNRIHSDEKNSSKKTFGKFFNIDENDDESLTFQILNQNETDFEKNLSKGSFSHLHYTNNYNRRHSVDVGI